MFVFSSSFAMDGIEADDRRKHDRFLVEDGALAVFGRPSAKVGQLIDIGMGGLAFRYMADKELPTECSGLDILLADHLSHLYGLPCETAYDVETTTAIPFTSMVERRRGVTFGILTPNQKLQLEHFIQNHTEQKTQSIEDVG